MNLKSRIVRGALLAVTVGLAVAAAPVSGGAVAGGHVSTEKAILKAIL